MSLSGGDSNRSWGLTDPIGFYSVEGRMSIVQRLSVEPVESKCFYRSPTNQSSSP